MTIPLGPGSIALGLHLSPGDAAAGIEALRAQAAVAEQSGFDGVTLSEHHGGFPGYLPVPTAAAGVLLAATRRIWSAPCPTILPLRHPAAVVEELAWLAAAYPGRVGAGFVAGYQVRDFEMLGADHGGRRGAFNKALPWVTAALQGVVDGPLAEDPAVRALAARPVPVVSGVGGPKGAAAAARAGAGLLVTSLTRPSEASALIGGYRDAGGRGPCVLVRRVWLGGPPPSAGEQLAAYRDADPDAVLRGAGADVDAGEVLLYGEGPAVAERLAQECATAGADALNLRVFAPGEGTDALLSQVEQVGAQVLATVRRRLDWVEPPAGDAADHRDRAAGPHRPNRVATHLTQPSQR